MPVTFFQVLFSVIFRPLFLIFGRLKVNGGENLLALKKEPSFLIMANHRSGIDPFAIGYSLPIYKMYWFCPFYFMTHYYYANKIILGTMIKLFGAYPVYPKSGPISKVLDSTCFLIGQRKNIFIFPEAHQIEAGKKGKARPGIAYLAKKYPNLKIIPVRIEGTYGLWPMRFFSFKHKIRVEFKPAFCYNDFKDKWGKLDRIKLAEEMMDKVWE